MFAMKKKSSDGVAKIIPRKWVLVTYGMIVGFQQANKKTATVDYASWSIIGIEPTKQEDNRNIMTNNHHRSYRSGLDHHPRSVGMDMVGDFDSWSEQHGTAAQKCLWNGTLWKDPPFSMGKSTISTGSFSSMDWFKGKFTGKPENPIFNGKIYGFL